MTFSQRIRRRWLRSLAFGLTLAAVAVPSAAHAAGGPQPTCRNLPGACEQWPFGQEQSLGFIRDSSETAAVLDIGPVTGFIPDSSQTATELDAVPAARFIRDSSETSTEIKSVPTPVEIPQAADQPAGSGGWRSIGIGLAAALGALLMAVAGVGLARRHRQPARVS